MSATSITQAAMEASKPEPAPCGECTACCKLPAIPDLDKPINRWCTHCTPGRGCGIYQHKPKVCSDYECIWKSMRLAPELRPDRCKFILEGVQDGSDSVVLRTQPELFMGIHSSAQAMKITAACLDNGCDVRVTDGNRMRIFKAGLKLGMGRRWAYHETKDEGRTDAEGNRVVAVGKVIMTGTTAQGLGGGRS